MQLEVLQLTTITSIDNINKYLVNLQLIVIGKIFSDKIICCRYGSTVHRDHES